MRLPVLPPLWRGALVVVIGVGVSTCRVGDLLKAPADAILQVTPSLPDSLIDSAAVGSTAHRLGPLAIVNLGGGELNWDASAIGRSPWIGFQPESGKAGDPMMVVLKPDTLPVGTYRDTVVITTPSAIAKTPVKFVVYPCPALAINYGDAPSGVLNSADCGAPHRSSGQHAQLYSFQGTAGDSATVILTPQQFNGYVALDTAPLTPSVPTLTTTTDCQGDASFQCIYYYILPPTSTHTYYVEVTSATTADSGAFKLQLIHVGRLPNDPDSLDQRQPDSTTSIPSGGTVGASLLLRAVISDSDLVDTLHLEAEVRPVAQSFSNSANTNPGQEVANGDPAWVMVSGLSDGVSYHWQLRAVDQTGRASAWKPFPGTFTVQTGHDPDPPTTQQYQSDGTTVIPPGDTLNGTTIVFKSVVVDQDGGNVVLRVEAVPLAQGFTGTATTQSAPTLSGTTATATQPGLTDGQDYHWQSWTFDGVRSSAPVAGSTFHVTQAPSKLVFTVQPTQTVAGATIIPAIKVAAQDQNNNTITSFTGNVTVAFAAGTAPTGAVLSGTLTQAAVAGIATFPDLSINKSGTTYKLQASAVVNSNTISTNSSTFTIVAGPATQLAFTVEPSGGQAGVPISPTVTVSATDAFFNVNTSASGSVALSFVANPGGGTLTGTPAPLQSGVATFTNLSINKKGTGYILQASSGSLKPDTSQAFTISAGPVTHLAFVVQPGTAQAGQTIAPPVAVAGEDANDNINTTFSANVTVAIGTNPPPGTGVLSGTKTQPASGGTATFPDLSINVANTSGSYTLVATTPASGVAGATSSGFNITTSTVDPMQSTVQPAPSTITASSGSSTSTITVTAKDGLGNLVQGASVQLQVTGASNTVLPATPVITGANGVATFTLSSTFAETKTITAFINSTQVTSSQPTVTVNPGTPASLAFTPGPNNTTAGVAINSPTGVVVTVRDQFTNTVTSYNSAVAMAVTGPGTFTPTSTTSVNASSGVAAFTNLHIRLAGAYTIRASIAAPALSVTSSSFNITPAPPFQLRFTTDPTTTQVLAKIDSAVGGVVVTVQDSVGNTTPFGGTVRITIGTDPAGGSTLAGGSPISAPNGVAVFPNLTLNKIGTGFTLLTSTTTAGVGGDESTPFNIIAGPAKTLVFKVQPSTVVAGAMISPAVQVAALDVAGDTATGFTGNVTMALNPSSGNLGGTVTVAAVSGIATFSNLTVAVAGNYTLTASATGVTSGTSNSFTVQPGGVSAINSTIGRSPTSITACKTGCTPGASTASTITVTAKDALGNPLAGKTVVLTSNGTGDAITQPASVTDVNGVAQGTISDTVTEAVTVSATISGVLINSTALVTVTAASPAVLLYITQPRDTTAGSFLRAPTGVQVRVQDQFHNNIPGNTSLVTLSILIPPSPNNGATLSGTLSKNAVNDVASFTNLSIDKVGGPYFLLAQSAGLTSDTSSQFSITPGNVSASQSTVAAAPTTITACSTSCTTGGSTATLITVTAKDGLGNGVAGASVTLTVSGSGNTTSPVSLTQTANGSGVATWTLNSTVAEGKTISASANGVGINLTASVTVNPAVVSASHSTVSANPTSITACAASCSTGAGTASQITVTARDQFDNPVPSASVTLAVSGTANVTNPIGATQTANGSGVATWTLSSTVPETKTISASANSVGITQTATVTVGTTGVSASQSTVAASLSSITACQTSCSTGGGTATVITVTAKDQFGNGVGGVSVTIAISGTGGNTTSPVSLTQTANGSGVATWTLNSTIAESKTITATANAVAITDNAVVTVNPGAVSAAQSTVTTAQATDSACSTSCTTGAGRASLITITAKDQFGNLIQNATVVMAGAPSTGNSFTAAPNTNSSGVSTSTFNSTKAEGKTISATVGGVAVTQTAAVTVIPAGVNAGTSSLTAAQSSMTACGSGCTTGGGTASQITVTSKDAFSNLIQNAKVVLSSTGSANSGLASPPNTNGSGVSQATFSSTKAEGKTVSGTLQVGSGTIVSITQTASVTVNPDVADHLTFTTEPTTTNQNATINPPIVVTAFDQFGNVATGYTTSVTLSITSGTGTGGAALNGTNTVAAIAGVATFSGMSIDTAGSQYSLDASDGSLTTTSSLFDIN
jgi:hypothetical protein